MILLTRSRTRSFTGGSSVSSLPFSICLKNSIFFLLARKHILDSVSTVIVSGNSYPNSQVWNKSKYKNSVFSFFPYYCYCTALKFVSLATVTTYLFFRAKNLLQTAKLKSNQLTLNKLSCNGQPWIARNIANYFTYECLFSNGKYF